MSPFFCQLPPPHFLTSFCSEIPEIVVYTHFSFSAIYLLIFSLKTTPVRLFTPSLHQNLSMSPVCSKLCSPELTLFNLIGGPGHSRSLLLSDTIFFSASAILWISCLLPGFSLSPPFLVFSHLLTPQCWSAPGLGRWFSSILCLDLFPCVLIQSCCIKIPFLGVF